MGGILYCVPEHRSCHRVISVWEICICQEFRVCSSLLLSLEVGTSASKQALNLLKICVTLDGPPVLKYEQFLYESCL